MIIKRFAELGTVIESQKRHMDRWKANELNLALSEQTQNLELIKQLGAVSRKWSQDASSFTVTNVQTC
jgi:hypothetical protein